MAELTEAELATRAGTTVDRVGRLVDLGILTPRDGSFVPTDIQRIRMAEAMEQSGLALEDLSAAIRAGHLSFAFMDILFPEPVALSDTTYEKLAASLGVDMAFLERLHTGWELPRPTPEQPVREDDLAILPAITIARTFGLAEAALQRMSRLYGDATRRLAQFDVHTFHDYVEEPLISSGLDPRAQLELATQIGTQMSPLVEEGQLWLYRRHLEHFIIEDLVEHAESALEQAGIPRRRPSNSPAISFLDLSGYTRLTEEQGDEAAAELAAALAELVSEASAPHGGRAVKFLGDGVMFHFPDPGRGVLCALELVERAPEAGMPPARVGVNAGPVVFRDGDYFGRTVNIASRIANYAGPGQVLVSEWVVSGPAPEGVRYEEIGAVSLKGLSSPITLYGAARDR